MKVVVCIKEVVDTGLNLAFGQVSPEMWLKELGYKLNPNDAAALAMALILKDNIGADIHITVISIGNERVESYLRDALACGADTAVRIECGEYSRMSPYNKAKILSIALNQLNGDLILTGARSIDTADGQTGPLLAAMLDIPCIGEISEFQLNTTNNELVVTQDINKGYQEKVSLGFPVLLTVKGQTKLIYPDIDNLVASREAKIRILSLSELGICPDELNQDPTRVIALSFPRPRIRKPVTPSSALPAFERILALLQGGIAKRKSELLQGSSEELVNQLFDLLVKENILKSAVVPNNSGNRNMK